MSERTDDRPDDDWESRRDRFEKEWEEAGKDEDFEHYEPAFRFGNAARLRHGEEHPDWNHDLEVVLQREYYGDYDRDGEYIRQAYEAS